MAEETTSEAATATANPPQDSALDDAVRRVKEQREEQIPHTVVSTARQPKAILELKVEVPREEYSQRVRALFGDIQKNAVIEGFRKGKAPIRLLERRFAREAATDVVEKMTSPIVAQYVRDNDVTMYGSPLISDFNVEGDGPVSLTILLEVKPEINLANYTGHEVEIEEAQTQTDAVENRLKTLQEHAATFEEADKAFEPADAAILDIKATDAKGLTILSETDKLYEPNDQHSLPEEVREALTGKTANAQFTVKVSGTGSAKDQVSYEVTVKGIKALKTPELDDDFAKDLGHEGGLAELRSKIEAELEKFSNQINDDAAFEKLMEKLVESHEFDVPVSLKQRIERDVAYQDYRYLQQTGLTPRRMQGIESRKDYEKIIDKEADYRVRGYLLVDAIGAKENVLADDSDVNAALEERAAELGRKPLAVRAMLERNKEFEQFAAQVRFDKVRKWLLERTKVNKVEPKAEETAAEAEATTAAAE